MAAAASDTVAVRTARSGPACGTAAGVVGTESIGVPPEHAAVSAGALSSSQPGTVSHDIARLLDEQKRVRAELKVIASEQRRCCRLKHEARLLSQDDLQHVLLLCHEEEEQRSRRPDKARTGGAASGPVNLEPTVEDTSENVEAGGGSGGD